MTREDAIECLSERVSIGKTCEQSCMVGFGVNIDTLDEAFDMAISAIRQQETVTNRNGLNEPLTENLRATISWFGITTENSGGVTARSRRMGRYDM